MVGGVDWFQIKVEAAAPPLIGGYGASCQWVKNPAWCVWTGFSWLWLVFLGIGFPTVFAGVGDSPDIVGLADGGWFSIVVMVLVGTLFTVSLCSLQARRWQLFLTLVETGVLPLDDAAAAVIGANAGNYR